MRDGDQRRSQTAVSAGRWSEPSGSGVLESTTAVCSGSRTGRDDRLTAHVNPSPRSVPSRRRWCHDLPGAVVAPAIWIAGSAALRVYLGHVLARTSVYGSPAAPIAVLAWLYLTALAVLLGAALNAALRPSDGQPSSVSA